MDLQERIRKRGMGGGANFLQELAKVVINEDICPTVGVFRVIDGLPLWVIFAQR